MTSHCIKCGEPFKHPPGRYTVCPSCKAAVARAAKKRWKKEKGSIACGGDEGWLRKLCVKSAPEVGKELGISRDQVLTIERCAIRKLREHKDVLKEAYEELQEAKSPEPAPLDLIGFQMAVGEWWAMADHFSDIGRNAEQSECVAQIRAFQRKIADFLNSFAVASLGGGS